MYCIKVWTIIVQTLHPNDFSPMIIWNSWSPSIMSLTSFCIRRPSNWTQSPHFHCHIASIGPKPPYLISSSPQCCSFQPVICLHLFCIYLTTLFHGLLIYKSLLCTSLRPPVCQPQHPCSLVFTAARPTWTCLASLPLVLTRLVITSLTVRCAWDKSIQTPSNSISNRIMFGAVMRVCASLCVSVRGSRSDQRSRELSHYCPLPVCGCHGNQSCPLPLCWVSKWRVQFYFADSATINRWHLRAIHRISLLVHVCNRHNQQSLRRADA